MNEYNEDTTPFGVLTLKTRQIYAPNGEPYVRDDFWPANSKIVDTPTGRISNGKSVVLWKNLNFLEIVGQELYDQYDLFSLELCQFNSVPYTGSSSDSTPNGGWFDTQLVANKERRGFTMYAKGLDWVHSSYSLRTGNDRAHAHLACLSQYVDTASQPGIWNNPESGFIDSGLNFVNRAIFQKPKKLFDLQLSLAPLFSNFEEVPGTSVFINWHSKLIQDFTIQFRIVPIESSRKFAA
jgi:hypothetical protein